MTEETIQSHIIVLCKSKRLYEQICAYSRLRSSTKVKCGHYLYNNDHVSIHDLYFIHPLLQAIIISLSIIVRQILC